MDSKKKGESVGILENVMRLLYCSFFNNNINEK